MYIYSLFYFKLLKKKPIILSENLFLKYFVKGIFCKILSTYVCKFIILIFYVLEFQLYRLIVV